MIDKDIKSEVDLVRFPPRHFLKIEKKYIQVRFDWLW